MHKTIFSLIREEISNFINNDIEIVDGLSFNQYRTIRKINLYRNSEFVDKRPISGMKKIFMNILNFRAAAATKFLNVDTKDFKIYPTNSESAFKAFLFEKELKYWLKTKNFSKLLNEMAEELPVYGSIVVKKVKDEVRLVDLRRLYLDPAVEKIQDSPFIIQVHYLTISELLKKKGIWENVDEVINRFKTSIDQNKNSEKRYIKIYERYGEVPLSFLTNNEKDENEIVKALFIVSEAEEPILNSNGDYIGENGLILFKSKLSGDYPYLDCHFQKIRGRWLGLGIFEEMFPIQERINEIANQKRVSMAISSMHLFQRNQPTPIKNILGQLENGDIITTGIGGEIKPIQNEERNLNAFKLEEERWDVLADRVSFVHEVIRGETLPATTPATSAVITEKNASSVFLYKRENFVIFLRELFNKFLFKEIINNLKKEHIFKIIGSIEDIELFDEKVIEVALQNYISEYVEKTGFYPSNIEMVKNELRNLLKSNGYDRFIKINADFYKDFEFDFDIVIDNEQVDLPILAQNIPVLLNYISKPEVLSNPLVELLVKKFALILGISPYDIEKKIQSKGSLINQNLVNQNNEQGQIIELNNLPTINEKI